MMFDSITATDLPPDGELVAGYIDGRYKWSDQDWALFPNAVKVRIAVDPTTNDGHVLDVETGAATPGAVPGWLSMRRAAGADPTVYVNLSNVGAVMQACAAAGVGVPWLWLALYDGNPQLPASYVAKQYANERLTGGHYDASVVADYWPGVDNVDQYVTKQEFEDYKVALQKQLDENYAAVGHKHSATASAPTVTVV